MLRRGSVCGGFDTETDFCAMSEELFARGWLSQAKSGGLKTRFRRDPWVRIPALA